MLHQPAHPIPRITDQVRRLARDMIDTMYANKGIGLAAPQVGQAIQLFVANPSEQRRNEVVMLNPVLETVGGRASVVEGCLSLPDVWERVRRAGSVRVRGQDLSGAVVTIEAAGLLAIILQHELDHLAGHLFIDRLPWFRRRRLHRQPHAAGATACTSLP